VRICTRFGLGEQVTHCTENVTRQQLKRMRLYYAYEKVSLIITVTTLYARVVSSEMGKNDCNWLHSSGGDRDRCRLDSKGLPTLVFRTPLISIVRRFPVARKIRSIFTKLIRLTATNP
jgi:hypothetical protein